MLRNRRPSPGGVPREVKATSTVRSCDGPVLTFWDVYMRRRLDSTRFQGRVSIARLFSTSLHPRISHPTAFSRRSHHDHRQGVHPGSRRARGSFKPRVGVCRADHGRYPCDAARRRRWRQSDHWSCRPSSTLVHDASRRQQGQGWSHSRPRVPFLGAGRYLSRADAAHHPPRSDHYQCPERRPKTNRHQRQRQRRRACTPTATWFATGYKRRRGAGTTCSKRGPHQQHCSVPTGGTSSGNDTRTHDCPT